MRDLQLLTSAEVAQIMRLSPDTVRQLATAGTLPGRKVGRAWRFPRRAIEQYLFDLRSDVHDADMLNQE